MMVQAIMIIKIMDVRVAYRNKLYPFRLISAVQEKGEAQLASSCLLESIRAFSQRSIKLCNLKS